MWQIVLANFLVITTCSIGIWANLRLCWKLFKITPYTKYIQWHTMAKGLSNVATMLVFAGIQIPTMIMNCSVYPEIVYRYGGALAGLTMIPARLNQLCLSFGTCYIAFFPFRQISDVILYSSMGFAAILGLAIFSIRIQSEQCSFEFLASTFAWTYSDGKCAQIVVDFVFYGIKFQIYSGYFANFLTFTKICVDVLKKKSFVGNQELANRLRKTKIRLAQCVIQDFPFLIDVTVQFGHELRRGNYSDLGFLLPFLFNTLFWNIGHTVDGLTMLFMLNVTKKVVRIEDSNSN
ncbi:unnamed protein product [Caenorhabditis angaria]|uniref:7TM GPCR serpentine receptor class x (Srx) domain-containing protein n=1 Tax=Caenorhabditis angaria TaxID=860376 RepID=A0A9P1N1K7_9PELO|nr:unnamed protein product [Caenorhabditis angaria]